MIFLIYYYDIIQPPSFMGKNTIWGPLLSFHFMRNFFYQIDWLLAPVAFEFSVLFSSISLGEIRSSTNPIIAPIVWAAL